ncbi:tripartite-type tricarboxylate transporter receptor subunit TctC [Orenia metallireducens]|jgi:tripartite-type tricarboxylate transporter receptor subunit TctC|uniref:Tripartite-type tricarboxylate transporter, receptor component TctC n=1 Tax=Orenia metallireducens TaxID=1413210 RepID=A0A285GZN2_9FIRM|nr:tripartite tricarboxylate transporter substrate binding protein [Orenia metallireducens]PRX21791.1 tripartite-type tricarboxylate transporter receptor subunit TctC [Orenia metallireducens]SNY29039.1 Tripartite-type tricarboxylate transporter, receptor component TctC [Orenia metallireducens]
MNKKSLVILSLAMVATLIFAGMANAWWIFGDESKKEGGSTYPSKPIQIIVPAGPGGDTDTNARTIAKYLDDTLGANIAVVNMEGAGSTIASQHVKNSKPDGHTVMFFHSSLYLAKIFGVAEYDFEAFKQGPMVTLEPSNTFLIKGDDPRFSNLDELVAYGKKHPGELTIGIETGGMSHMVSLAFADAVGVEFNFADVGGQSAKNAALLGGHVDLIYGIVSPVLSYIKSGDMISLGITAEERQEAYDFIPTFIEQGYKLNIGKPYYFLFPKDTPQEIVDTFTAAVKEATEEQGYKDDLAKVKLKPNYKDPEEARSFITHQRDYFQMLYNKLAF